MDGCWETICALVAVASAYLMYCVWDAIREAGNMRFGIEGEGKQCQQHGDDIAPG